MELKRAIHRGVAILMAGLVFSAAGCASHKPASSNVPSSSSGLAKPASLQIPEFSKFNALFKNRDFTLRVREEGGEWQDLTPYTVRINPNLGQNIKATDPVKESPMAYFGMGERPVEIEITRKTKEIASAVVHPLSAGLSAKVTEGKAIIRVQNPRNICVELDGDRYEMVYLFAFPTDTQQPLESSETVKVIPAGLTNGELVGTNTWKGGIRDVRIYEESLSEKSVSGLAGGQSLDGYVHRWALSNTTDNEMGIGSSHLLGTPKIQAGYGGGSEGALVLNGFEDAMQTGVNLVCGGSFTVSAWVYLEPGQAATRTILNHVLMVEADGTVASYIGDWQFPYRSTNKLEAGSWHHVALTKQGSDVTVYIDGVSGGTQTRPDKEESAAVIIGSGSPLNGVYVKDGQTLYLSPGAVFHGTVIFYGVKDAALKGSGIIDVTPASGYVCGNGILTQYSDNIMVDGVIVNNPSAFTITTGQSKNVTYHNVKTFSSYGASDGINTKASEDVVIDGCFIRSNDDAISISASSVNLSGSTRRVTVKNTCIINDVAHSFLIGGSGREDLEDVIETIRVENVDIIDSKQPDGGYQGVFGVGADGNGIIRDVSFRNIRIQNIRNNMLFNVYVGYNPAYSTKPGKGIENLTFSDITYTGNPPKLSLIMGYNASCLVKGVRFENVIINGERLKADSDHMQIGNFTENITFS